MGDVTAVLDADAFRDYVARAGGDVETFTKRQAEAVADEAARLAPRGKTGQLARSIGVAQNRAAGRFAPGWNVTATAPHAVYVHEGTRAHPIVGNPLLAFWWEKVGAFVVLPKVAHPGTDAQPFLTDAIRRVT